MTMRDLGLVVLMSVIGTGAVLPIYQDYILIEHLTASTLLHGDLWVCRYRSIGGSLTVYYQRHPCEKTHQVRQ